MAENPGYVEVVLPRLPCSVKGEALARQTRPSGKILSDGEEAKVRIASAPEVGGRTWPELGGRPFTRAPQPIVVARNELGVRLECDRLPKALKGGVRQHVTSLHEHYPRGIPAGRDRIGHRERGDGLALE